MNEDDRRTASCGAIGHAVPVELDLLEYQVRCGDPPGSACRRCAGHARSLEVIGLTIAGTSEED